MPGASPKGVDVRDYADVGVTNVAVATGLTLQDGNTYFVTVRGQLFMFIIYVYFYVIFLILIIDVVLPFFVDHN